MALITLRVLDGADRGRVFADVPTPFTIGREEGNPLQLNDERISRFHLKIQEDQDKIVLTDLQSTNGTKVNGETVQIWSLRPGCWTYCWSCWSETLDGRCGTCWPVRRAGSATPMRQPAASQEGRWE